METSLTGRIKGVEFIVEDPSGGYAAGVQVGTSFINEPNAYISVNVLNIEGKITARVGSGTYIAAGQLENAIYRLYGVRRF